MTVGFALLLFTSPLTMAPETASAAQAGTITTCTLASLQQAANAGGVWKLECSGTIDGTVTVGSGESLTLVGSLPLGQVTLQAGPGQSLFEVEGSLALVDIEVTGGNSSVSSSALAGAPGNAGVAGTDAPQYPLNYPGNCSALGGTGGDGTSGTSGGAGGTVYGGAIYNSGTLVLNDTLFSGIALTGGSGGLGGNGGAGGHGGDGGAGGTVVNGQNQQNNGPGAAQCPAGPGGNAGDGGAGGNGGDGGDGGNAYGGAVYNTGTLTVVNSIFEGDSATGGAGGYGGAPGTAGSGGEGGAGGWTCTVPNSGAASCASVSNSGNGGGTGDPGVGGSGGHGGAGLGGAIFNGGEMTATNSTFESDSVRGGYGGSGGAGNSSDVPQGGQAGDAAFINCNGNNCQMVQCGTPGNGLTALAGPGGGYGGDGGGAYGGAIYSQGSLTLTNVNFTHDAAAGGEGGNGGGGTTGGTGGGAYQISPCSQMGTAGDGGQGGSGGAGGNGGNAVGGAVASQSPITQTGVSITSDAVSGSAPGFGGASGTGGQPGTVSCSDTVVAPCSNPTPSTGQMGNDGGRGSNGVPGTGSDPGLTSAPFSTATTTAATTTSRQQTSTSTSSPGASTTSGAASPGGIPEFPPQLLAVGALTFAVAAAYLAFGRKGSETRNRSKQS